MAEASSVTAPSMPPDLRHTANQLHPASHILEGLASNCDSSMPPSPHALLPNSEQSRMNPHTAAPQLSSDARVPPQPAPAAHSMPQPANVPARAGAAAVRQHQPQQHGNQAPIPDVNILRRYPIVWQGLLALKNAQASVQMHFVSGNPNIPRVSLPPTVEGESQTIMISQRMRLDQAQLDGVYRKIQITDEHCILMALPCGKDHKDLVEQTTNLKFELINYLLNKSAAGIVNVASAGTQEPSFVIHIFPSCDFIQNNLSRIAPSLLHLVSEIAHFVIIIATV